MPLIQSHDDICFQTLLNIIQILNHVILLNPLSEINFSVQKIFTSEGIWNIERQGIPKGADHSSGTYLL